MKTTLKTTLAVIVLGYMFAAVIPAKAAPYNVTSYTDGIEIRGNQGASYDLDTVTRDTITNSQNIKDLQDNSALQNAQITSNNQQIAILSNNATQEQADRVAADLSLQGEIEQEHLTNNNQQGLIMQNANDISSVDSKLDSVNKQLTDSIVDESNARSSADSALGQRLTTLENAPRPTNGVDGKDGVTTTVTKVQVDTATQAKVDSNSKQVAGNTVAVDNVQSRQQAQETTIRSHSSQLSNHEERITALESESNNNFQNLKNDVDNNRKRAAVGVASVAAMSNIPQVTDSQTFAIGAGVGEYDSQGAIAVGFSARVTERVVTKASVGAGSYGGATVGAGVSYGW